MPRCTALTRHGTPCRALAVRGSDPPRCRAHRPPPANTPAPGRTPPAWGPPDAEPAPVSLHALIADLVRRVRELSQAIDALPGADPHQFAALVKLQGELTSRIARLLRQAANDAPLDKALHEALDHVARSMGIEL